MPMPDPEPDDLTPQEWNTWLRGLRREWGMTVAQAARYLKALIAFCDAAKGQEEG